MTKTHTVRGDVGMDGSAATSSAERTRSQISRAFANRTANGANAQSELFEQLLNLSFTVQPPPEKEPEPLDTNSSIVDGPSKNNVDKEDTKVEEEKDDEPTVAIATAVQAVPLIEEKPVELTSDHAAAELQTDSIASNTNNSDSNSLNEQVLTPTGDAESGDQVPESSEQQLVVANSQIPDSKADSALSADKSFDDSATEIRIQSDDSSREKTSPNAIKIDDSSAGQSQEIATEDTNETKASIIGKTEQVTSVKPEAVTSQKDEGDDRRGDRREKWFERKDEAVGIGAQESTEELSSSKPVRENTDLAKIAASDSSSQPSPLAAPSVTESASAPPPATPVALPAALSVVPQNSTLSTSTPGATLASSTESTNAITSAPSRSVGGQPAKANAKEKVTEPGLSQQERVRVIQRIARSFNRISSEGGSINLRLHPEHLGSVSVQVRLEGRSLSARLSTETVAARDAIMQDIPALRQRLADQGFDVTKFQVDVAGNGADASFAQSNGQSQFSQSENRPSSLQIDYRRVAANREARAATIGQIPPPTNLNWQSGAGIDLQA